MSLVNNIDRVAFASALEVDKVFPEEFVGSFSVGASSSAPFMGNVVTHTEANLYGEDVLPVMQFSTDSSTWYDAGAKKFSSGTRDSDFTATCYTTSNSLVIVGQNFTGSSQICYYRAVLVSDD